MKRIWGALKCWRRSGKEMVTNIESVLLDTSVWIDALQGRTPHIVKMTQELLNEDRILTCGPVIFEIKRGLRPPERKKNTAIVWRPNLSLRWRNYLGRRWWFRCFTAQKRHYHSTNGCYNCSSMPASQSFSLYPGWALSLKITIFNQLLTDSWSAFKLWQALCDSRILWKLKKSSVLWIG